MSRIDELIQRYCPDGVQYIPLGEICSIETGRRDANAAVPGGNYNFYTTSKVVSRIETYRWDTDALLIAGNANVGDVKHFNGKFDAYQRTYVLTEFSKVVISRFLYYAIKSRFKEYLSNKTNTAAMTYIVLGTLKNFKIPVPPLEVQREIVSILDAFTQLEAELEAELEARRQQYEHYRDQLLTCEQYCPDGVENLVMGEVATISGNGVQPSAMGTEPVSIFSLPSFDHGRVPETVGGTEVGSAKTKLGEPCVLVAKLNPHIPRVWRLDSLPERSYCSPEFYPLEPFHDVVDLGYLYYFVLTKMPLLAGAVTGSTNSHKRLHREDFLRLQIPVPPLEVQREIVSILDKFDALVNDLSSGLPAEITARRQQYEYYRDKLLTFDELTPV